jgi:hypothetical protein
MANFKELVNSPDYMGSNRRKNKEWRVGSEENQEDFKSGYPFSGLDLNREPLKHKSR